MILFATNPKLKKILRRPYRNEKAAHPGQLERRSVFVIIEESKLKVFAPLLHIITAQTLEYMTTRKPKSGKPILMCLDEFPALGKLDIMNALRTLRKRRVRIMVLVQSMADLDMIYGENERKSMMNCFLFQIVLGADDADTQDYFSRLIGERTVTRKSISRNDHQVTQTDSE